MARRATVIKQERAASPHVLLLDAGNSLFGSEVAHRTQGRSTVALMNALGYDAAALGEMEFWFGLEVLQQRMAEAEFPFLSANVVSVETGQLVAKPYIIKQVGGRRVGIIGLTSPRAGGPSPYLPKPLKGRVTVRDPIETGREVVARVRREADVVILLAHLRNELNEQLAREVPGIDAILGGCDGQVLYPPRTVSPTGTLMVAVGKRGEALGVLRLSVDEQGEVKEGEGSRLVVLDPNIPEDPALKALVKKWKAE